MSAGYALTVSRVVVEDRTALMHVLAVTTNLELADALRLLGERPAGTVGRVARLPVDDLPAPGDVVRLDAETRWPGTPATNGVAARRGRRQRALGSKP
jgi:hypothetical protein